MSLINIEKQYCGDIIKFFCEEYPKMKVDKEFLKENISKQVENRLLNTNLILDYRVDVMIFPKTEKRDIKINDIITDSNTDITSKIIVCVKYRDTTMTSFETIIK